MRAKTRFIKSVISEAKAIQTSLPFERKAKVATRIERLQPRPLKLRRA